MIWYVVVAVVAINILKGGSILAVKLGLQGLPPVLGAGIRFTAAGILILGWFLVRKNNAPDEDDENRGGREPTTAAADLFPRDHLVGLAICALMMAVAYALYYWAIAYQDISRSALFVNLNPFHVAVIAHFTLGERLSLRQVGGLVVAFVAVVFVEYRTWRGGLTSPPAVGDLLILTSGLFWAGQAVLKKKLGRKVGAAALTIWEVLPMGLILLVAGSLTEDWGAVRFNGHAVGSLVYLTFFGTAVAFLGFNWVLRQADASRVAPFSFVIPLTAYALGILVLNEPFHPELAFALVFVVIGLYAVTSGGPNGRTGHNQ